MWLTCLLDDDDDDEMMLLEEADDADVRSLRVDGAQVCHVCI